MEKVLIIGVINWEDEDPLSKGPTFYFNIDANLLRVLENLQNNPEDNSVSFKIDKTDGEPHLFVIPEESGI